MQAFTAIEILFSLYNCSGCWKIQFCDNIIRKKYETVLEPKQVKNANCCSVDTQMPQIKPFVIAVWFIPASLLGLCSSARCVQPAVVDLGDQRFLWEGLRDSVHKGVGKGNCLLLFMPENLQVASMELCTAWLQWALHIDHWQSRATPSLSEKHAGSSDPLE